MTTSSGTDVTGDEAWQGWVGRQGEVVPGPYPVSVAAIGYAAEAVEDAELLDRIAAGEDVTAPPTFVTPASRVPNWRSPRATGPSSFMQALLVPMQADAAVNLTVDQRYETPLRPGDSVSSRSTITAIEPRSTRLGDGLVITEEITHWNQRDEVVARTVNSMYRYAKAPRPSSGRPPAPAEASPARRAFDVVAIPMTMTKLVTAAGGLRDFSPLHHDVELAQAAGHRTAFVSFSYQQSLVGRLAKDWLGHDVDVRRIALSMKVPVYVDRTLECRAEEASRRDVDGGDEVVLDVVLATEDGRCATAVLEARTGGR